MEHIRFWSMLMVLIWWAKTNEIKNTQKLLEATKDVGLH
jgi:hypothetical protein